MRDFESYYAAGATWARHADPYGTAIWKAERAIPSVDPRRYEVLPFVGPPVMLPIVRAFAALPFGAAALLWRITLLTSAAALALCALSMARRRLEVFSVVAVAACIAGFGPATSAIALGQIALPAFAATIIAAVAFRRSMTIGIAASAAAWIQPNVALPLVAWFERRAAAAVAAGFALFVLACVAVAGPAGGLRYLHVLQLHAAAERFSAIQLTPAAIAYGFGASEGAAVAIGFSIAFAAIVLWLALVPKMMDPVARFCASCALLPFVLPFFHEHDLIVAFAPAVVFAIAATGRSRSLAIVGAILCAIDWLGLAQRPAGALQSAVLCAAFIVALFSFRGSDWRRGSIAASAAFAALIAATLIARRDPTPVWPDAMRRLPPSVSTAPIAQVWHAETAATGLFERNELWAALRCVPLVGCLLLTAAAVRYRRS